jgi:hypothetical protein
MAEETGQRVSLETMRQRLKRNGIVLSSSPDPDYMVKKRRLKTRVTS